MGRKSKCSAKKIEAVEKYLSSIRDVAAIVNDLLIRTLVLAI
jgi:hypothetical protein